MNNDRPNKTWTPERSRRMLELRDDPALSYTAIARRLSEEFDCYLSANSIAGHVNRLGLPPRLGIYPAIRRPARRRLPWSAPEVSEMLPPPQAASGGCQWPTNAEGEAWRVCGVERLSGRPYCAEHAARAYVTSRSAVRRPQGV